MRCLFVEQLATPVPRLDGGRRLWIDINATGRLNRSGDPESMSTFVSKWRIEDRHEQLPQGTRRVCYFLYRK